MRKIEMVDLRSQYERLKADIDNAISGVINSTAFIKGPDVHLFEEELQRYLGIQTRNSMRKRHRRSADSHDGTGTQTGG